MSVDWLASGLAIVLVALAGVLTGVAWAAARRFEDRRFFLIGIAFLTLSLTGVLSILSESFGAFDEAFTVEPAPLFLIVLAVAVLYVALFQARLGGGAGEHG